MVLSSLESSMQRSSGTESGNEGANRDKYTVHPRRGWESRSAGRQLARPLARSQATRHGPSTPSPSHHSPRKRHDSNSIKTPSAPAKSDNASTQYTVLRTPYEVLDSTCAPERASVRLQIVLTKFAADSSTNGTDKRPRCGVVSSSSETTLA